MFLMILMLNYMENDIGASMIVDRKGKDALEYHTQRINERLKSAQNIDEVVEIMKDWLRSFRKGHWFFETTENFSRTILGWQYRLV